MIIDDFLGNYYNKLKENGINKVVVAPESMIVKGSEDDDGWVEWKPVNSNIDKDYINKIEEKYKIKISSEYTNYILNKQFMDIEIEGYKLFGINENNTLEKQIDIFPNNIITYGFIPIGQINDEDFISLNTNTEEIVSLSYDDYSVKKVLYKDFNELIEFLIKKI